MQNDYIKNVYEVNYKQNPDLIVDREHPTYIHLMHFLPRDRFITILDAACGQGKYSLELKRLGYENVYAIDLFDHIQPKEVIYRSCNMEKLPQEWTGKFDFIFCNSAIYYLKNPMVGLQEFNRCLKPGGTLFFTAHTKYSVWTLLRKINLFFGLSTVNHLKNVHFDRDVQEYLHMLDVCGYEPLYINGYYLSMAYAFYERVARALQRRLSVSIPVAKTKIVESEAYGLFRARYAYHSIIVAVKPMDGGSKCNDF